MAVKDFQEEVSETGNWNVAKAYSHSKILSPLIYADEYLTIATFGALSLINQLNLDANEDYVKLRAFERLIFYLIMVIDNSIFAVKKNKEKLIEYREKLQRYKKIIPKLYDYSTNQLKKTKYLKLKEKVYNEALDEVSEIRAKINEPLNQNHLIFTDKEIFNPNEYKKKIKERFISGE